MCHGSHLILTNSSSFSRYFFLHPKPIDRRFLVHGRDTTVVPFAEYCPYSAQLTPYCVAVHSEKANYFRRFLLVVHGRRQRSSRCFPNHRQAMTFAVRQPSAANSSVCPHTTRFLCSSISFLFRHRTYKSPVSSSNATSHRLLSCFAIVGFSGSRFDLPRWISNDSISNEYSFAQCEWTIYVHA